MNLVYHLLFRRWVFAALMGFAVTVLPVAQAQPTEPPPHEANDEQPPVPPPPAPRPSRQDPANRVNRHGRRVPVQQFPFTDHLVREGEYQREVVSINGSNLIEGEAEQAVAIFGNNTVKGHVHDQVVTIFGNTYIDGRVDGQLVSVLGNVNFGPHAVIDDQVVIVGGNVNIDPAARVRGDMNTIPFPIPRSLGNFSTYFHACVLLARPLAFNRDLTWAWIVAGVFLTFYLVLSWLFRPSIEKCVITFEQRPGMSVIAAFFTMAVVPLLLLLLVVTGVGFLLVPLVLGGLFLTSLVGRTVMSAWLGRRFKGVTGEHPGSSLIPAVLAGGLVIALLYAVPFFGFFLWQLLGSLGIGVVFYTLILSSKRPEPIRVAATSATFSAKSPESTPTGSVPETGPAPEPTIKSSVPPVQPVDLLVPSQLPRAGFWIRIAALVIDVILVGIVSIPLGGFKVTLVLLAIYAATLWQMKATTVGGIVCGLKVVRLDDKPLDWSIAIVRALGCFLSLAVVGLGFIWVAFDPERQSWHDKIAGTTVVHCPKGVSLL